MLITYISKANYISMANCISPGPTGVVLAPQGPEACITVLWLPDEIVSDVGERGQGITWEQGTRK